MKSSSGNIATRWSLLTSHGHVLVCVAAESELRMREIAEKVGVTERRAAQIVNDLEAAGYLTKIRDGRRNRYQIDGRRRISTRRLPTMTIAQLLALLQQALDQQSVS